MLVAELILPSSRVPGATFGAEFLHEEFTRMSLTERDFVWSGPDYLPKNCGGLWEGNGVPVHDSITLDDDDSAVSVPILAAWATSSVIRERQRQAIARLAEWGAKRPAELAKLLLRFAKVDDVQVVESVAVAAAGSVLELIKPAAADVLAKAVHENFFEKREEKDQPSVAARHAARVVIERAFAIGTELPDCIRRDANPPYAPVGPKLPIDVETVALEHGDGRYGGEFPLSGDFDWYVAKEARDPFFEYLRQSPEEEPKARRFENVPEEILSAAVGGRLGVNPEVKREIQKEIARREERRQLFSAFSVLNFDVSRSVGDVDDCTDEQADAQELPSADDPEVTPDLLPLEDFVRVVPTESLSPPSSQLSPEAEAMLADYAHAAASAPLTPRQLRNGLIAALYKKWGWNKKTFYGAPNGAKPGEVLGADIAIMRRHPSSTHGSRSPVAMFAEKYIWSAVNVVASFLSDRLPGKNDSDDGWEMITNQSNLGSGMPDPLAGHRPDPEAEFRPPWNPAGIAPMPDLTEKRLPERGIEWLDRAGWPDPADWLAAGEDDPILLSGFLATNDHSIGIQIASWVSCIAVPKRLFHLIERDVGFAPSLWTSSFSVHEIKGHFGGGVYAPMRLAVWAPWSADDETRAWHTLSDSGIPMEIPLAPLVTETHWEGTEGETLALSPAKLLRVAGGIINCHGADKALRFIDGAEAEVGYYQHLSFPDDWGKANGHLQIDRSKFFRALREKDLVPVWGVRVYRELLPELRPKGEWKDQDSYWLVVSEDGGKSFRSVLVQSDSKN